MMSGMPNRLVGDFYDRSEPYTGCYDCGRQYGGAYGFPDLIVPDDVWEEISPTGDEGGLLCPSCIVRRLVQLGVDGCDSWWSSGPLVEPQPEWSIRENRIGSIEDGEDQE